MMPFYLYTHLKTIHNMIINSDEAQCHSTVRCESLIFHAYNGTYFWR